MFRVMRSLRAPPLDSPSSRPVKLVPVNNFAARAGDQGSEGALIALAGQETDRAVHEGGVQAPGEEAANLGQGFFVVVRQVGGLGPGDRLGRLDDADGVRGAVKKITREARALGAEEGILVEAGLPGRARAPQGLGERGGGAFRLLANWGGKLWGPRHDVYGVLAVSRVRP